MTESIKHVRINLYARFRLPDLDGVTSDLSESELAYFAVQQRLGGEKWSHGWETSPTDIDYISIDPWDGFPSVGFCSYPLPVKSAMSYSDGVRTSEIRALNFGFPWVFGAFVIRHLPDGDNHLDAFALCGSVVVEFGIESREPTATLSASVNHNIKRGYHYEKGLRHHSTVRIRRRLRINTGNQG